MSVKGKGRCLIDAVAVGDVTINFFNGAGPALSAKFAYEDSEAGLRRGYGTRDSGWSPETLARLLALAESMEQDICLTLFEHGATSSGGAVASTDQDEESIRGL